MIETILNIILLAVILGSAITWLICEELKTKKETEEQQKIADEFNKYFYK